MSGPSRHNLNSNLDLKDLIYRVAVGGRDDFDMGCQLRIRVESTRGAPYLGPKLKEDYHEALLEVSISLLRRSATLDRGS